MTYVRAYCCEDNMRGSIDSENPSSEAKARRDTFSVVITRGERERERLTDKLTGASEIRHVSSWLIQFLPSIWLSVTDASPLSQIPNEWYNCLQKTNRPMLESILSSLGRTRFEIINELSLLSPVEIDFVSTSISIIQYCHWRKFSGIHF